MDRAFKSGASATPPTAPASPSIGYASEGNPGALIQATKPGPWWFHMITEELLGIVLAAGITPAQGTLTQIKQALDALYMPKAGAAIKQLQIFTCTQASNILTGSFPAASLDYRSATAGTGTPNAAVINGALTLAIPATSNLGMVLSGGVNRLVWAVAYNAGTPVLCVANFAGGLRLDEENFISPTTIGAAPNSSGVWYSASAVAANSPYRIVGATDVVFTTGTGWSSPSVVQPAGGQALSAMSTFGFGQKSRNVTGSRALGVTYFNDTPKPITFSVSCSTTVAGNSFTVNVDGVPQVTVLSASAPSAIPISALNIVVCPGESYSVVNNAGCSLLSWIERR